MADNTMSICAIVGIIAIIAILVYLFMKGSNSTSSSSTTESYANIGDISNLGAIDGSYPVTKAAEFDVPTPNFADMIDCGNTGPLFSQQPKSLNDTSKPMERLERIQGSSLLPRTSRGVTSFNVDVADPQTYSFQVAPRVVLKDPRWLEADPYRGDIPINYCPNVCLVGSSSNGRSSQRLSGFFSDQYEAIYNKYVGKCFKNMPIHVVNEEVLMDSVPCN